MRKTINTYKKTKKEMHLFDSNNFLGLLYTLDDNGVKWDFSRENGTKRLNKLFRFMRYWSD